MTLTDEQRDFRDAVRDFCARECATREQREALLDPDEEDQSAVLYAKLAALGWLGVAIPEEYGGSGGTYVEQTILFEELFRGLAPVKAIGATTTVAGCYKRFGSQAQAASAGSQYVEVRDQRFTDPRSIELTLSASSGRPVRS